MSSDTLAMLLSVVIPVCNEQESLPTLYDELLVALESESYEFELIFVDDGSTDRSYLVLAGYARRDDRVRVVRFRRNYGQTAALQAGLEAARGDVIVTLDADLQNDPADIPMMVEAIGKGYDLVHGWRRERQDWFLSRRLPSLLANRFISRVTGFPVHDLGCTLKAMRREIAEELELYGEMHRFIPILAHWRGARCLEVETHHRARQFGRTKYGISRTLRVVLDTLTVKYIVHYFASPMKLFGGMGLMCGAAACLALGATVAMKFAGVDMTGNPLLLLSAFASLVGIQLFSLGLLGEVNARIYFGTRHRSHFTVRERLNLGDGVVPHGDPPTLTEDSPGTGVSKRAA